MANISHIAVPLLPYIPLCLRLRLGLWMSLLLATTIQKTGIPTCTSLSCTLSLVCALPLPHSSPSAPLSRSLCLCLSLSRCDGLGVCFSSNNKLLKNLCTRVFGVVRCTNNNNNNSKHVSPANVVVALYDFYLLRFSCFCAKFFSFPSPRLVSSRLKLFASLFFAR